MPDTKSLWDPRYRRLIIRLKAARGAAGLSQEQVAKKMGWGQSSMSKIERFERRIDPIELVRLARLYRTTAERLLREK